MEKLIFLHIPKSAGSTLRLIFRRKYRKDGFFMDGNHPNLDILKRELVLNKKRMFFGHMDFGVNVASGQPHKYATLIRDPIERVISQYYYVKRQPNNYLHNKAFKENNLSLAQYVESGLTTELNNGQVRILIGAGGFHKNIHTKYDIPFGKCEPWMLEEAKLNIEKHFVLCGLQEYFDESLVLIKKELNWNWDIGYISQNITHQRKKEEELDDRTLKIIRDANALDIELYEWVKARFLVRIEKESSYIEKEMQKLKWAKHVEYYRQQIKNALRKIIKISK